MCGMLNQNVRSSNPVCFQSGFNLIIYIFAYVYIPSYHHKMLRLYPHSFPPQAPVQMGTPTTNPGGPHPGSGRQRNSIRIGMVFVHFCSVTIIYVSHGWIYMFIYIYIYTHLMICYIYMYMYVYSSAHIYTFIPMCLQAVQAWDWFVIPTTRVQMKWAKLQEQCQRWGKQVFASVIECDDVNNMLISS